MIHLGWKKNLPDSKKKMLKKQLKGLIGIFLILAIIPFFVFFFNYSCVYKIPDYANQCNNTLAVEISNTEETGSGIYFTGSGMKADQLLQSTGLDIKILNNFELKDGMKLIVDSNSKGNIAVERIDNLKRIALGMTINLNMATEDDLLLIPGIGEVTAEKILKLRQKKIRFRNVEELMEIEGIKEKKLTKLKQYLSL